MELSIKVIVVGNWKVNCYLITLGNDCWLVDPGDEFESVVSYFNLDNLKLNGIINTHGHFDHIGAVAEIKEKYNVPFLIHSKDERLVYQSNLYRRMAGDLSTIKTPSIDKYLDDLSFLELHDKRILIHYTPGHTNGGVCFEIAGSLFTGDLFFEKYVGRTDLPGGNIQSLSSSISFVFDRFMGFRIYPGHGESFILDKNLINKLKPTI
jgi:hydroxyacylglutathione hydrolase